MSDKIRKQELANLKAKTEKIDVKKFDKRVKKAIKNNKIIIKQFEFIFANMRFYKFEEKQEIRDLFCYFNHAMLHLCAKIEHRTTLN